MTTTYYTPSGNPTAETRGISAQVRAEFASISAAFTSASADIAARGAIAGQTWSGTHTFPATTYGVTAAFGSSGTAYATLDYVNAVATNAALPGQANNADKLLTTNGTTASFTNTVNVSVVKFVDGTDKTKQVQIDASGLTTGTTRTLTVQDASGTLVFTSQVTAAAGTSMALLSTDTVSSAVATINRLNVFTSAYDKYLIEIEGVLPSASSTNALNMRFAKAGVLDTTSSYIIPSTDGTSPPTAGTLAFPGNVVSAAGNELNATVEVRNANATTGAKGVGIRGAHSQNTIFIREGAYLGTTAITGFGLYWSAGANFTAGTVRVYGIKNS
jgi:hypothetical protein